MSGTVIWTGMERRWRDTLLDAMIPSIPASRMPGINSLDLSSFWVEYLERAPFLLRAGFRLAVWIMTFLPILTFFSSKPFHQLTPDQRDAFLIRASSSNSYLVRQLATTIKLIASLAYFHDPIVRGSFPLVRTGVKARTANPTS